MSRPSCADHHVCSPTKLDCEQWVQTCCFNPHVVTTWTGTRCLSCSTTTTKETS